VGLGDEEGEADVGGFGEEAEVHGHVVDEGACYVAVCALEDLVAREGWEGGFVGVTCLQGVGG
jgi:hypothetical protein